jgi:isopenicillin N synthase-like dioxygenase
MGSMGVSTTHHLYPPFPSDIKTAPLVSISLSKLEAGNEAESKAFFDAAKNLGFFYMKLEGSSLGERIVNGAEELHRLQQQFFGRPNEEKEEFAREKIDPFFGYRKVELKFKNDDGTPKRNETYNASRSIPSQHSAPANVCLDAKG